MLESKNYVNIFWFPGGSLINTKCGKIELVKSGWFYLKSVFYGPFESEILAWQSLSNEKQIERIVIDYDGRCGNS